MKNLLLTLLTAGLLIFSGINCASTILPVNMYSITNNSAQADRGKFIGQDIRKVIEELGEPTNIKECKVSLPVGDGTVEVMGDEVIFEQGTDLEKQYLFTLTKLCSVFSIVVSQTTGVVNLSTGKETTSTWNQVDRDLLRRVLQDNRGKDGRGLKYIPKAKEMEL